MILASLRRVLPRWLTQARQRPSVFISCVAQHDNLGDLVLRRVALQWIPVPAAAPHVLVAKMPAGFVAGLGLPTSAITYTNTFSWLRALSLHTLRRDGHIMFAPGPQSLSWSRGEFAHAVGNLALAILVKSHDGHVIKLGRALSAGSSFMLRLERALASQAEIYTVRDQESQVLLRSPRVSTIPDVALADDILRPDPLSSKARRYLALSFREDREVRLEAVQSLVDQARSRGWEPILVTQVGRDDDFHTRLGRMLNCQVLNWPEHRSHRDQLEDVLAIYDLSHAVVSNRLHSLIFGMARGAVALSLASKQDTKISKTFRTLGIDDPILRPGQRLPDPLLDGSTQQQALRDAQQPLTDLKLQVGKALLG